MNEQEIHADQEEFCNLPRLLVSVLALGLGGGGVNGKGRTCTQGDAATMRKPQRANSKAKRALPKIHLTNVARSCICCGDVLVALGLAAWAWQLNRREVWDKVAGACCDVLPVMY